MARKKIKYETKKEKEGDVCELCGQNLSEVTSADLPDNPQKEKVTIKDTELQILDSEQQLEYRLLNFQIYDRNHHLVPIDLIDDKEKEFYFCGEVMAIAPTETEKSVMTISSPIVSSSIGEELIMLTTCPAKDQVDYTLQDPHPLYQELYNEHMHMVQLLNVITKRCEMAFDCDENLGYDELLEYICDQKEFSSEDVLNYISFICKHILSYEEADADDGDTFTLMNFPATRHILDQGGYDIPKRTRNKAEGNGSHDIMMTDSESENDNSADEDFKQESISEGPNKTSVTQEDKKPGQVFTTELVTSMCKFMKINCNDDNNVKRTREKEGEGKITNEHFQPGEELPNKGGVTCYKYLMFSCPGGKVETGSYVKIITENDEHGYGHVLDIRKWKGELMVHIQDLDIKTTIEDNVYHQFKNELFKAKRCSTVPADCILPARVKHRQVDPKHWRKSEKDKGSDCLEETGSKSLQEDSDSSSSLFWRYVYDYRTGRYEYPTEDEEKPECFCDERFDSFYKDNISDDICIQNDAITGISSSNSGFKIEKGSFYYLTDDADKILGIVHNYPEAVRIPKVNYREDNYYYPRRKDTMDPFIIIQVREWNLEEMLRIRVFCRPENTNMSYEESKKKHFSCLYFSKKDTLMTLETLEKYLVTTCAPVVVYGCDEDDLAKWCHQDPHRFYVTQKYNQRMKCFEPLKRIEAQNHKIPEMEEKGEEEEKTTFKEVQPLKTLDIFSGAGGLSTGLEESGAAKVLWAIECDDQAAKAFERNHSKECKVISEDCNVILKKLVKDPKSSAVVRMPLRGEVDMIVGGPPCQGFSKLNQSRFQETSKFKNSQVANFLGYVDFYRPRFVLMENVRNLVFTEKHSYYESILATLVHMGYQYSSGVLQAGNYGIAQWRRRFFIIAAAPGETLPQFPEPTTVFPGSIYQDIELFNYPRSIYFHTNRNPGAPRRMVTTWDIISDLPNIRSNVGTRNGMNYAASVREEGGEELPCSKLYFRNGGSILYDHVCSKQGDINQERIKSLPKHAGADWRDLPNISVKVNGKMAKQIVYKEYTAKNGSKEGVCHCILSKDKVNDHKQQSNTFIPYFLVHTAHRKRNWVGTFGRVPWDGFFQTTLTSPSVTGKQGQVIHPDQDRICSVREFARSQGFRDTFRFEGSIADKYKQVGNAVPPPLAKALGLEIRKCLVKKEFSR